MGRKACFVFLCKFIANTFWLQLIRKIHWLRGQKLIEVLYIFFILLQLQTKSDVSSNNSGTPL